MRLLATSLVLLGLFAAAGSHEPCTARAASDDPTAAAGKDASGRNPEAKPRPKFTLGKETTYVTGPRDADGRIDYVAALNERLRRGVTPASNANVLFWQAFGPRPEGDAMPEEFFKWLGIEAPPERGDYLISLHKYATEQLGFAQADIDALYDQLGGPASQAPWTAKQYPAISGWLKANEKPLALAVEATKRPHYFLPLVPYNRGSKESTLISALIPSVQRCRELASALPARAMLHAGEGRHDKAWQDLLACHRLGRLVARGGTLIEHLVGIAIDHIASGADLYYVGRARLTVKQIKDCLRDLQRLPPMPNITEKVDVTERFIFLDAIMMLDRNGIQAIDGLDGKGPEANQKAPDARTRRILEDIDWDTVLRVANRWHDRVVSALRARDRGVREKQLDQFDQELAKLKQGLSASGGVGKGFLTARNAKARGQLLGDTLVTLLFPALRKVNAATDRIEQTQRNLHVAFALEAYRREHGRYPDKLEALVPGYLERIPGDLFSGKALIYRQVESAYLLYSVGANGQDDQGRTFDDDPPGDDLRVRMPLPKLKKK
jgi:hypothetical protein